MIFDAGVFIALEKPATRGVVLALIQRMQRDGIQPQTNDVALAQVWRDPPTQVPVSMLVRATSVHEFGDSRLVGMQCARAGTSDVVDASLAVLAAQLDLTVLTTDPDGMKRLGVRHQAL